MRQVGFRGQGDVQFRRAAAQQRGRLQVRPEHRFGQLRRRLARPASERRLAGSSSAGNSGGGCRLMTLLEVALHRIQGVRPGVAFVVNEAFQHGDRDRGPLGHEVFDRPGQAAGRAERPPCRSEKTRFPIRD